MKIILFILICIVTCTSCVKEKPVVVNPMVTKIPQEPRERVDVVPLYVEEIPFESSWTINATDGNGNPKSTFDKISVEILYPGADMQALSVYREGIPFENNVLYNLSFASESTVRRRVEVKAFKEDGTVLLSETLDIGDYQEHSFEIINKGDSDWNGKIIFNIGNDGSEEVLGTHDVTFSNVLLKTNETVTQNIKINQLGYLPNAQKKFVTPYNVGDYYNVIDTKTNEVVYKGVIGQKIVNEGTGETNFHGNFSDLITPGTYKIQTQIVSTSYEFVVEDSVYDGLLVDSLKMLTLQRSGTNLDKSYAQGLARSTSHAYLAYIYDSEETIDVTGGWYDAGDYGRYIKTGSKAVMDLMLAYYFNPQYFNDNFNTKDSGNGISDIIDEIRYELDWMLKMQHSSGGVYNKVVSSSFAGYIAPEDDKSNLYVLPISTNATGDFAGVMAFAAKIFKGIDDDFSSTCLQASVNAYNYLENNLEMNDPLNPENFDAGEYRDDSDKDERFFAAAALYNVTGDGKYLEKAKELVLEDERVLLGLNYQTVGTYGEFLILDSNTISHEDEFYQKLKLHLGAQADNMSGASVTDGYFISIQNNYNWGSNGDIANNGMLFMLADYITPNDNYVDKAFDHLHYLLGRNSLNMSFVTSYGVNYPKNIHNRMTIAKNTNMVGALVGGPNRNLEDAVIQGMFDETSAPAKVYADDSMSYSTNEVAIYWNSSLVFLISSLKR